MDALKRTNYGKEGHLRSIMSTPVSGSARLVAVPHVGEDYWKVYLSRNLAEKVVYCFPERDENGNEGSRYREKHLEEGDYVMLERPPSLTKYNNQPFVVGYWDKECIGVHPTVFGHFHGDYDGDEVQLYALGTAASVREAQEWTHPVNQKFVAARRIVNDCARNSTIDVDNHGDMEFMRYSTISFGQISAGVKATPLGDLVRCKDEHLELLRERMHHVPGTSGFLREARDGVDAIMRQQLSQGTIGDMSRVSRIAAMCFLRGTQGGT